jgi:GTP:adenosylcobinamide-phosphate guanylyltransferase
MDAIVIAGGVPGPDEPLYPFTQGAPKALLDVAGKPMAQWVLDALDGAETIDRILVIGLDEDSGLHSQKVVAFMESEGSILLNIRCGVKKALEINPSAGHVTVASADIPGIRSEHVDWVVRTAMQTDEDVYYNVITRQVMEARYPGSKRSYTRLKDVEVCGGDLNVVRTMTVTGNDELWERIIASRKNVFKQAALLGYDTLLLLLLRRITLEGAIQRVTRRVNLTGRALLCPYAEIGMDVDKPHQLELMRADLSRSTEQSTA